MASRMSLGLGWVEDLGSHLCTRVHEAIKVGEAAQGERRAWTEMDQQQRLTHSLLSRPTMGPRLGLSSAITTMTSLVIFMLLRYWGLEV